MDIPGYYYDQDKKKYFKIQAGTSGSAYSSRDVKRRKVLDAEAEAASERSARQQGRIRRSAILNAPSAGGILEREYGRSRQDDVNASVLARGLCQQNDLKWNRVMLSGVPPIRPIINPIFAIHQRPDIGVSTADYHLGMVAVGLISKPSFDDLICASLEANDDFAANENTLLSIRANLEDSNDEDSDYAQRIGAAEGVLVPGFFVGRGMSTSLSVHEETSQVLMTWLASSDASGIGLTSFGYDNVTGNDQMRPRVQLGPGTSRGSDVSVYSSAAAPASSSLLFAIGTSHGVLQVDKSSQDVRWITPKFPESAKMTDQVANPRDVFALEFLRNDPSVLLSGGRKGILGITDLRIPIFDARADTIQHPSSITHIRQINDHAIIVAGLNSSLCHYDLRFRKVQTPAAPAWRAKSTRQTQVNNVLYTAPILQYHDYHNPSLIPIGFDIDVESGLVAAAQQSQTGLDVGCVHLYSLRTGNLLRSMPGDKMEVHGKTRTQNEAPGGWVQCLRFSRGGLYFGSAAFPGLCRYAWADTDQSERLIR
ncbi:hypothetical protein BP5796_04687 [Coleophoma crateriformis]|uniref:Myocyte-specific enhancer factor 2d n=1 Tax=Coleophoma crateriformis TaxID=565419 RepID=A0A3D8SA17_9HELO|nr:hypothetical protein BP5796_04687 [Coleophoma crateriformis]